MYLLPAQIHTLCRTSHCRAVSFILGLHMNILLHIILSYSYTVFLNHFFTLYMCTYKNISTVLETSYCLIYLSPLLKGRDFSELLGSGEKEKGVIEPSLRFYKPVPLGLVKISQCVPPFSDSCCLYTDAYLYR